MRSATLDFYARDRATVAREAPLEVADAAPELESILPAEPRLERVAGGFEFTEGPVWSRDGGLLFSSPNTNAIYPWDPVGKVTLGCIAATFSA